MDHPRTVQHRASCPDCQVQQTLSSLDVNLDRVWATIEIRVWNRPVGRTERWLGGVLRSPGLARALLTTPSLVLSWILASAAILAIGAIVTHETDVPWVTLLAPAIAAIGIAYAYGPGVDPAWELSQTMVVSGGSVFLARALAVFGVNAGLGIVASLFSAQAAALTLLWLVPMTTLSALALAAAAWARNAHVGVGASLLAWAVIVLATWQGMGSPGAAVTKPSLLPAYALATAVLSYLAVYGARMRRNEVPL